MRLLWLTPVVAAASLGACSQAEEAAPPPAAAETPTAQAAPSPAPAVDPALDSAVAAILGDEAASTRTVVRVVGEGDGRLALVYLVGMNWCGSGGCNLLILRPGEAGWDPVGNVSRVRPPVRLLTTTTNGLPDLGVTVSGGGGPAAYEAKLVFDGRTYPRFPPDDALTDAEGAVVIADADIAPPTE